MLIWYFDFTIFSLVNVSHICLQLQIYFFNFIITKLSWHVLCYLTFKNLYTLQNTQLFVFQLIYMQLRKWLNSFFKAHKKQLNQYCTNFTIFLPKKKSFKKIVRVRVESSRVDPQKTQVESQVNLFLLCVKKFWVRVGYFSGRVKKFWPVFPCLYMRIEYG